MNRVMKKSIKMPVAYVILVSLIVAAGLAFYYSWGAVDPRLSTLAGGVSGGIIVYIISFVISIYEYRSIDRFRQLGVQEILPNRRESGYYKRLVGKAKEIVVVTGTSCARFIDDFADTESEDHVLIDALRKNKNLTVKFLVPTEDHMDAQSRAKFEAGKTRLRNLLAGFEGRIEVRQFGHEARYSFVRIDSELIVGPVFTGTESRNSPAIHLDADSSFAEKYLGDFGRVWDTCQVYA